MPYLPIYGWADENGGVPAGSVRLFDRASLVARMEEARRSKERVMQDELSQALKLGEIRRLAGAPTSSALKRLEADFPHFAEVLLLIRQRTNLAHMLPGQVFSLPPLLLAGEPGVGKTAFAEALAKCLNQSMKRLDVASATASFALAGAHETWSDARHGAVWSLLQAPSASGVLLLDEIDKAAQGSYPVLGPLYSLLEPVSSKHFADEYVQVPVDASHLIVVATCNDTSLMEPALLSRLRVVEVPAPSREQMPAIARSVYRQLRATRPWGAVFSEELPMEVIERLSGSTPRELSRLVDDAVGRAASAGRQYLLEEDINADPAPTKTKHKLGFI